MTESLTEFAARQQRQFDATTRPDERKERGHFGTGPAVADFMAGMLPQLPLAKARVLDPGAGVGTLSAAVCEWALRQTTRRHLDFELWENDPALEPYLRGTMEECRRVLRNAGHELDYSVRIDDFVLGHAEPSLFVSERTPAFDVVITNPPYFKLRKTDRVARAMPHVVHGQPNIYTLFMAVAADRLRDGGVMVAITPRSYFNGSYFKRFRKWFFDRMTARRIHVFESRTDAFREDDVLQENVILSAVKAGEPGSVVLTSSPDREFRRVNHLTLPYARVVEDSTGDRVVRVATNGLEGRVVEAVDGLPHRFHDLPFKISTGPVVTFRSTGLLRAERSRETAPLLWMHNVRPFVTQFPSVNGKPTHILVSEESQRLLVPARRYVLLKRFTAKEERRRLVAGIVEASDSYSPVLGLENHLNYVYRAGGELTAEEALGLAALFNSALMDRYFRAISGSTQVNATEMRALPMPALDAIRGIGHSIAGCPSDAIRVERAVGSALGIAEALTEELCEASR